MSKPMTKATIGAQTADYRTTSVTARRATDAVRLGCSAYVATFAALASTKNTIGTAHERG